MSTSTSASCYQKRPRSSAPPPRSRSGYGPSRRAAPPGHPPGHHHRDALVHAHLALADRIAAGFHRRYAELVELDDLRQEARLELVRAAARAQGHRLEPYLQRCITGALRHHMRDRALLVRLPAKRRDAAPWRHVSLDAPAPGEEESRLERLVAPVQPDEVEDALGPELAALLAALPEPQALVLRLTVLEGWSLRLAAQHLGVTPATVKRAQLRGLEGVRLRIGELSRPGMKMSRFPCQGIPGSTDWPEKLPAPSPPRCPTPKDSQRSMSPPRSSTWRSTARR